MATAKSKSSNPLPWIRNHKFYSLVLFIVLLVVVGLLYQLIAKEINKRQFQQARAAIDTVYTDIVAQVGQPDNYKRANFCSRPNREFEPGPLSCDVSTAFIYGVDDESQANTYLKKIQAVISNHKSFKLNQEISSSLKSSQVVNMVYHTADDGYKISDLSCNVSYVFDTPRETNLALKDNNKRAFEVNIECVSLAQSPYYTLR